MTDSILVDPSDERRILDFRPLGFRDAAVLGRYVYATAHGVLEGHTHGEMLEICFLESGEQTYVVDGTPYHLTARPGQVTERIFRRHLPFGAPMAITTISRTTLSRDAT